MINFKKAKEKKVKVSEKGGRYIFDGDKNNVNDVFNFAFDKSINRGNYAPATMMHEEVELDEKAGDENDMKKLVGELQNASKMHLAQSKRVQAHVDMMTRANAKGPEGAGGLQDLKKIVGELEKASQAHLRQSKTIAKHMEGMSESLDEAMKYNFMVLDPDGRVLGMSKTSKRYCKK